MTALRTLGTVVLLLAIALNASAQAPSVDDGAYRLGADAARAARSDPTNAESIVAARYREALALATDEASRGRTKSAFQRGYQEALASAAPGVAAPAPAPGRLKVGESEAPPATAPSADSRSAALGGEWSIMYAVWGTPAPRQLVLVQDGTRVTGRLTTAGSNTVRVDGAVSGETVRLTFIYDDVEALAEILPAEVANQVVGIRSQAEMRKEADGRYVGTLSAFRLAFSGTPPVVTSRANGGSEDVMAKWSPSRTSMVREGAPSPVVSARASASAAPPQSAPSAPAPPARGGPIFNVTTAHGVGEQGPVRATDVFTPDTNPIFVWFRHQGLPLGTTVTCDWFYEESQPPLRITQARATVGPEGNSGHFSYELAPGKHWPAGRYRIELRIDKEVVAETRFRVAAGSAASPPSPRAGPGPRPYVHPAHGYQFVAPVGWSMNDHVPTADLQLRRDDDQAMVEITSGPVSTRLDPVSYAAGWESVSVGPGKKLRVKRASHAFNLAGEMAYEAVYEGEGVYVKVLFTGVPDRFFVMTAVFGQDDFPSGEKVFDAMVQTFKPTR